MTKISIDVDFNKDPEAILREIQEKAKTEVEKREKKELITSHLDKLHLKVNQAIGTSYGNANDLIRALAHYATPSLRDRILGVTSSGRRQTISMSQALYDEVKAGLERSDLSKAQLARNLGVSTAQVRKVEKGGFDAKFEGGGTSPSVDSSDDGVFEQGDDAVLDPVSDEEPVTVSEPEDESMPEADLTPDELSIPEAFSSSAPSPMIEEDDATDAIEDDGDSQEDLPEEEPVSDSFGGSFTDEPEPLPLPESFDSSEDDAAGDDDSDVAASDTIPPVSAPPSLSDLPPVEDAEPAISDEDFGIPSPPTFEPLEEESGSTDLPTPEAQLDAPAFPEPPPPSGDLFPPVDIPAPPEDLAPPADIPAPPEDLAPPADIPAPPEDLLPPVGIPAPSEDLAPPAEEPASPGIEKPKPMIKFQSKKKPTLTLGKGKLSQQVTRPPISREGPPLEPPPG